jgi:uncharacterized protein YegL
MKLTRKIEGEVLKNIISDVKFITEITSVVQREDYINLNGFIGCIQNFSRIEETSRINYNQPFGLKNSVNQKLIDLTLEYHEPATTCNVGMDVVFILDYTSSMGDVINSAKAGIIDIINEIKTESGSNDYRLSLILVDEYTSQTASTYNTSPSYTSLPSSQRYINTGLGGKWQWITAMEMLSLNNETSFITQLNKINLPTMPLGNGVGSPEPTDMALDLVINYNFTNMFRENVAKLVIIITDAEPSGDDDLFTQADIDKVAQLTQDCINKGIKVLVLGTGAELSVWQNLATHTGGAYEPSFTPTNLITVIQNSCSQA